MNFPRSLTNTELEFIRWLLPEHSSVYATLIWNIEARVVLGEGRWGTGDLMMGVSGTTIDLSLGMAPVIAYGECITDKATLSISAHEANVDDVIEVQFSGIYPIPDEISVTSGWTYSYWKPGMACPATGAALREVAIHDSHGNSRYTLALSPTKKTIWLHHHESAFNQLLAVTAFADELLRTHHIRDAKVVTQPAVIFDRLGEFSDDDLRRALIEYNTFAIRKFDTEGIVLEQKNEKRSLIGKILKRS